MLLSSTDPMTLTSALIGGLTVLGGAVAHLYHAQSKTHAAIVEEKKACEEDRRDLWRALVRIDPHAEELRNRK